MSASVSCAYHTEEISMHCIAKNSEIVQMAVTGVDGILVEIMRVQSAKEYVNL